MIGDNIKKYRKRAGLTQKQLADKLEMAEITIRQYESNRREPKFDTLIRIADALGVPLDLIISLTSADRAKSLTQEAEENKAFFNYLESLGYSCIDAFLLYGEESEGYIIYPEDPSVEYHISESDLEDLMDFTEAQIVLELTRLTKHKKIN